ncbi:MAG: HD domain-containing protein [Planctomycetota bacterium]|nr:HD domain-containing protein [Planctomycetota bacterium]
MSFALATGGSGPAARLLPFMFIAQDEIMPQIGKGITSRMVRELGRCAAGAGHSVGDTSLAGSSEAADDDEFSAFESQGLSRDPVHGYIRITAAVGDEIAESTIIDSKWVQRLRRIHQLQTALWVFPSGEHTRFQHSLGTMHLGGIFARRLYPSLARICPGLPSKNFVEEVVRVAGLLHDIGHGPFGHFLDEHFLQPVFGINHESIGVAMIKRKLGQVIGSLKRSPSGPFAPGERISPAHVAFLIKKPSDRESPGVPQWLTYLRQLFSGIYTIDNMDFVLRDSYMCGIAPGGVDIDRLITYSFFTREGLTLHKAARSALRMFMLTRLYLFDNVYHHRTTRAMDIQLKEIFGETIRELVKKDPMEDLDEYCDFTEWYLLSAVAEWSHEKKDRKRQRLAEKWERIQHRQLHWKEVYDRDVVYAETPYLSRQLSIPDIEREIRNNLPDRLKDVEFQIDMAQVDPRPDNPLAGPQSIRIYDPYLRRVETEYLSDIFGFMPTKVIKFRIYMRSREHTAEIREAASKVLRVRQSAMETNV